MSARETAVHLCFFPAHAMSGEALQTEARAHLSAEELARFQSFQHPARAEQFLRGRILMRRCLAAWTGRPSTAFEFSLGSNGKPALAGDGAPDVAFSLSHNRDTTVIALAETAAIGVDIELTNRASSVARIARRFFSPREVQGLDAGVGDLERGAIVLWTLKESIVKALGSTIWHGLSGVELALDPAGLRWLAPPPAGAETDWSLTAAHCAADCALALAVHDRSVAGRPLAITTETLGSHESDGPNLGVSRSTWPVTLRSGSPQRVQRDA